MKLEEAIKHAKDVATKKYRQAMLHRANAEDEKLDRCIECMKEHEQLAEWLEELKELKEYKEKYRWHDLRKNPDDLPEDSKDVLVTVKGGCVNRTWHDSCGWRNATAKRASYYSDKSVLAWREIEEFESEGK